MADIGNEIDAIRAALVGEQVREDIAVALEKMNEEAASARAEAEAWATGGTGGTPSETNNAKAYAEAAEAALEAIPEDYSTLQKQVQSMFLPEDVSGQSIDIYDGAESAPVSKLTVSFEPVQASGTPSAENPIPITGRTTATVQKVGKNLCGGDAFKQALIDALPTGTWNENERYFSFASSANVAKPILGQYQNGTHRNFMVFKANVRYTFILTSSKNQSSKNQNAKIYYDPNGNDNLTYNDAYNTIETHRTVSDADKSVSYLGKSAAGGTTRFYVDRCGVFEGDVELEDYAPFEGVTATCDFSSIIGTLYGGEWDVINGKLYVRYAEIASYTGDEPVELTETEWLSSMDTYVAGEVPTIGAQVVYKLASPEVYEVTPFEITTSLGKNTFYTFDGAIDLTYSVSISRLTEKVDASIEDMEDRVDAAIAKIDSESGVIPDYYEDMIASNILDIRGHMAAVGANGFTFFFITDSHWNSNSKHSPGLIKRISSALSIETILHGGDIVSDASRYDNYKYAVDTISALKKAGKVFAALGNHDFHYRDEAGTPVVLTADQAFGILQQQESYLMSHYANGYYYTDIPGYKTRLIVLNTGDHNASGSISSRDIDPEQAAFLSDALDSTPQGWHIVVCQHIWRSGGAQIPFADSVTAMLDSYNSEENRTGFVEAVFIGHNHRDYNLFTPGGIPIIATDCDRRETASETEGDDYGETRQAGTVNEQCFDTVTIDYANKVIYCVRTGYGVSRTISYAEA